MALGEGTGPSINSNKKTVEKQSAKKIQRLSSMQQDEDGRQKDEQRPSTAHSPVTP